MCIVSKKLMYSRFRVNVELLLPLPGDLGAEGHGRIPETAASSKAGPEIQQDEHAQKEIELQRALVSKG